MMQKNKRIFAGMLLLALFLTGFCACGEDSSESDSVTESVSGSATATESVSVTETETEVYHAEISAFLPYLDPDGGKLLLANKSRVLGADFVPARLTALDSALCLYGKTVELEHTAAMALSAMLLEMRADGITGVYATSGYRSYERQAFLFSYYQTEEAAKHPSWTAEEVRNYVLTYSAAPGTSEHQTGLCADLITDGMGDLYNYSWEYSGGIGFAETEAYQWLCANAHRFGFILRYPENKELVTGYSYESWHYRFVGKAAAAEIHEKGITLEEYLK